MRALAFALAALIALIQYPLWVGKGGWFKVWELQDRVTAQQASIAQLQARNDALEADVRDLKQGTDAIEERARYELGMVKRDEIFFQLIPAPDPAQPRR